MNFTVEYKNRKDEFETYLSEFTNSLNEFPDELREAAWYSLLNGGKRLRPVLFLETVRIFNGQINEATIKIAIALECIHTYSLIHDDLPCMDDDDLRRGQPTCHKKFGEAIAVLTGDALLNSAYELLFQAVNSADNAYNYLNAALVIALNAGGNGMIGGQVCDMRKNVSAELIDYIYVRKTANLIQAAITAGALVSNANKAAIEKMSDFGKLFGYCFQLCDDLLDKNIEETGKNTYLNLFGEEQTVKTLAKKTDEAVAILKKIENTEFLIALTINFMKRKD